MSQVATLEKSLRVIKSLMGSK